MYVLNADHAGAALLWGFAVVMIVSMPVSLMVAFAMCRAAARPMPPMPTDDEGVSR